MKTLSTHTGCLHVQLAGAHLPVSYFIRPGPGIPILYLPGLGCSKEDFRDAMGHRNLAPGDCFFSRMVARQAFDDFRTTVFPAFVDELARSRNEGYAMYAETLRRSASVRAYWDYSRSLVEACDRGTLFSLFTGMEIPILFIYGEENRGLPYLEMLKKSSCRLAEIKRSNHFPGYDNPDEFYAVIGRFARSCSE